jgi:hypothetical protein
VAGNLASTGYAFVRYCTRDEEQIDARTAAFAPVCTSLLPVPGF